VIETLQVPRALARTDPTVAPSIMLDERIGLSEPKRKQPTKQRVPDAPRQVLRPLAQIARRSLSPFCSFLDTLRLNRTPNSVPRIQWYSTRCFVIIKL